MLTFPDGTQVPFIETRREQARVWQKFDPATVVLPQGWTREEGYRSLPLSLIWHRDTGIPLRDGKILYADVFRPEAWKHTPLPVIISYSPYGKTDKGIHNSIALNVGISRDRLSGLESFEGLDPAEWCQRGYIIVNVDARGVFESEGDFPNHGTQEGQDGYDVIEWIAEQSWSNGAVGMAGNSWLAGSQWPIAMQKPPHLKALAPWEGATDTRRHVVSRGGIGHLPFVKFQYGNFQGKNKREDSVRVLEESPLWNDYWEDKTTDYDSLDLPMYIVASYSTGLHAEGSVKAFNYSRSKDKWLRIHPTQEWHDLYIHDNADDLQRFFDRYLLNKKNDWEATPRVRISLIRYNAPPIVSKPEFSYPPTRIQYRSLYLDATENTVVPGRIPSTPGSVTYSGIDGGGAQFTHRFQKRTEMIGFARAILYMSTDAGDDFDVFLALRKLDVTGKALYHMNIPLKDMGLSKEEDMPNTNLHKFIGPNGQLRASLRHTLPEEPGLSPEARKLTTPGEVTLSFQKVEKVQPGEIVKMDIQIWPAGVVYEAGESLQLDVKGSEVLFRETNFVTMRENPNKGNHTIYTSEGYPSRLILPLSD